MHHPRILKAPESICELSLDHAISAYLTKSFSTGFKVSACIMQVCGVFIVYSEYNRSLCTYADTEFLLSVLRTAKFSQLRAREIIENILTMKTKLPHLLANLDSHDPTLLAFIERG